MKLLESMKQNFFLNAFAFFKIPMIFFISPKVIDITAERCEVRVPLNRRTKNHLGSMYFGTLCTAADVAGGLLAMRLIQEGGNQVSLVFKDFKAEFLKRPDADVHFVSTDGQKVKTLVEKAMSSGERVNETVVIIATCPKKYGDEVMARFELTLSLKRKSRS